MVGKTLDELGVHDEVVPTHFSVKESVFPFNKFPGVDIVLGPEMRSTGEVMGIDDTFPMAFAKSQMAANTPLPIERDGLHLRGRARQGGGRADRPGASPRWAIKLIATRGTARLLRDGGHPGRRTSRRSQEGRPNLLDQMKNGEIALVINTPSGQGSAHRRGEDSRRGRDAPRDVHHDALGREGRGRGVSSAQGEGTDGGGAAGALPGCPYAATRSGSGMTATCVSAVDVGGGVTRSKSSRSARTCLQ